jgi:hydroxymethylpyrimidine/phosphomethylpyrimidine kinase
MIKVLSIAGSDPSSGAGIQADLKVFAALGVFGMAVPAALTIQNSQGVAHREPVSSSMLSKQLAFLLADIRPDAVKTGMLLTRQNVQAVTAAVKKFRIKNLVIDPVMRSSSGKNLLEQDARKALIQYLFPCARIITPNIPEAETLTGVAIRREQDMDRAAALLLEMGPSFVLIKGGHQTGPATDTLYGKKRIVGLSTIRRKGEFHGTGCLLSSALTVFMARGYSVEKAVEKAKHFVDNMLKTARPVGKSRIKYFQF